VGPKCFSTPEERGFMLNRLNPRAWIDSATINEWISINEHKFVNVFFQGTFFAWEITGEQYFNNVVKRPKPQVLFEFD